MKYKPILFIFINFFLLKLSAISILQMNWSI